MHRHSPDRISRQAGFSLLELLVVVVVIGIISALAVPNLNRGLNKSKETATEAEILKMVEVVKLWRSDTEDCIPRGNQNRFKRWAEENGYYKNLDINDSWGNEYKINVVCNARRFRVVWRSYGIDGKQNARDDVHYIYEPPTWDGWRRTGTYD